MRKRILLYAAVGSAIGMAMVLLVPALFNRGADGTIYYYSERLLARCGSDAGAMIFTLLLYGVYGAGCVGGMLLYEIERWPLALATAVHYAVIALGYYLAATLLYWELSPSLLLLIEGMMTLGFVLIWLLMYLRYKAQVRELNEMMKKKNEREGKAFPSGEGGTARPPQAP